MLNLLKNKFITVEGITLPTRNLKGHQCAGCPKEIFLHNEIGRKLHKVDGKPYCVTCRIMRTSKFAKEIKENILAFEIDKREMQKLSQAKADKLVEDIAIVSKMYENVEVEENK